MRCSGTGRWPGCGNPRDPGKRGGGGDRHKHPLVPGQELEESHCPTKTRLSTLSAEGTGPPPLLLEPFTGSQGLRNTAAEENFLRKHSGHLDLWKSTDPAVRHIQTHLWGGVGVGRAPRGAARSPVCPLLTRAAEW